MVDMPLTECTQPDMGEARNAYLKDVEERAEEIKRIRQSNKAARAYARTYKTGVPLVPQYIVTRVMDYISKATPRKKPHVVLAICKYWSLKREARRGAPLLKRLHLEVSFNDERFEACLPFGESPGLRRHQQLSKRRRID